MTKRSIVKHFLLLVFLLSSTGIRAQKLSLSSLPQAAAELSQDAVSYDPSYFSIDYPMGDVPANKGVCTDVVIRAYRKVGLDLQELVHKDMKQNFGAYPQNWGLKKPDSNIDHRRVPNLMCFFTRQKAQLKNSSNANDYQAGDLVCWDLGSGVLHIGIVLKEKNEANNRPLIMHNIGAGQVKEDILFQYAIIGHFRYKP
jgi:uncharacterized protein YijF (DUF1287 family)